MTVTGVIIINGEQQSSSMLEVGAFCGEECRASGFATPFFTGEYIVSLTIVSNVQSGETINFRLYDHNLNMERTDLTCFSSVIFTDLQFIGAPNNWFPIEFNSEMLVSATVNPAGAGEVNGTGMYAPGSTATLTAVPTKVLPSGIGLSVMTSCLRKALTRSRSTKLSACRPTSTICSPAPWWRAGTGGRLGLKPLRMRDWLCWRTVWGTAV